jgi:hypothetical protein
VTIPAVTDSRWSVLKEFHMPPLPSLEPSGKVEEPIGDV